MPSSRSRAARSGCCPPTAEQTESEADERLDGLLREHVALAFTDAVLMELPAGAVRAEQRRSIERMLGGCEYLATQGPGDYAAADIYRACRRAGSTVRSLTDCLIAAVAIRAGVPVLHADRDFDAIALHVPLAIA